MPLVLGGAAAPVTPAYTIANSCRFSDASSHHLTRTPSSSGDPETFTISCWLKRGVGYYTRETNMGDQTIVTTARGSGYRYTYPFYFNGTDDTLYAYGGTFDGGSPVTLDKKTVAVFRDTSAWYHYYFVYDTTETAAADRIQLYINGTQITDAGVGGGFSPNTIPGLNVDSFFGNTTDVFSIGGGSAGGSPFDGYMAEFIFVDGTVPPVTEFGEFNEDSPTIWQPKDPSEASITWGTNGLWLDFQDSADLGNDVSGQGNDMVANNFTASDQGTDSPTNNFCVMNCNDNKYVDAIYTEGNNQLTIANGIKSWATGTLGMSAGKWYWEVKMSANTGSDTNDQGYGIVDRVAVSAADDVYGVGYPANYVYESQGRFVESETTNTNSCPDTYTTGDIMMFALDLVNDKIYYGKNGTWQCSGDPTSGASGTGAEDIKGTGDTDTSGFYFPSCSSETTSRGATWQFNFGGCSAFDVASANQDGNGYGNFEYAVPSGYLALCTKNLGSDGG